MRDISCMGMRTSLIKKKGTETRTSLTEKTRTSLTELTRHQEVDVSATCKHEDTSGYTVTRPLDMKYNSQSINSTELEYSEKLLLLEYSYCSNNRV